MDRVCVERESQVREHQEPRWRAFLEWFFSLFLGLTTTVFGLLPILSDLPPSWTAGGIVLISVALAWKWSGRSD